MEGGLKMGGSGGRGSSRRLGSVGWMDLGQGRAKGHEQGGARSLCKGDCALVGECSTGAVSVRHGGFGLLRLFLWKRLQAREQIRCEHAPWECHASGCGGVKGALQIGSRQAGREER